jgi:hypothetical protein
MAFPVDIGLISMKFHSFYLTGIEHLARRESNYFPRTRMVRGRITPLIVIFLLRLFFSIAFLAKYLSAFKGDVTVWRLFGIWY